MEILKGWAGQANLTGKYLAREEPRGFKDSLQEPHGTLLESRVGVGLRKLCHSELEVGERLPCNSLYSWKKTCETSYLEQNVFHLVCDIGGVIVNY